MQRGARAMSCASWLRDWLCDWLKCARSPYAWSWSPCAICWYAARLPWRCCDAKLCDASSSPAMPTGQDASWSEGRPAPRSSRQQPEDRGVIPKNLRKTSSSSQHPLHHGNFCRAPACQRDAPCPFHACPRPARSRPQALSIALPARLLVPLLRVTTTYRVITRSAVLPATTFKGVALNIPGFISK